MDRLGLWVVTPAQHKAAMDAGDITHVQANMRMYSSKYGAGVFNLTKITEFGKTHFRYRIMPEGPQFKAKSKGQIVQFWIRGPVDGFETSKAAVAEAHKTHSVRLKQHINKAK